MGKRTFRKSSLRTVKSTITRFISIVLISFLGAGVFAGLAAISPNMGRAGDTYYDQQNMMDIRILSTYGFTAEDIQAFRATDGISGVMASYTVDAVGAADGTDYTFRLNGLVPNEDNSNSDYINQLMMLEGRWPENEGEAIIVYPAIGLKNIALGSQIQLDASSSDALEDSLEQMDYTIVGIAKSPFYLFFMQGNTAVGRGVIDYILYVPEDNFIVDGYTDVHLTVDGAKELAAFADEYFSQVDITVEQLKALAEDRQTLRYENFMSELADAKLEFADAELEAEEELADARIKLADGWLEIADADQKYAEGVEEYYSQRAQADEKFADAEQELEDARIKLEDAQTQIDDNMAEYKSAVKDMKAGRTRLDEGWDEYNANLAQVEAAKAALVAGKLELDAAQAQYDAAVEQAEAAANMTLEQLAATLPAIEEGIQTGREQLAGLQQLAEVKAARDACEPNSEEYLILDVQYQAMLQMANLSEEESEQQIAALPYLEGELEAAQEQYDQLVLLVGTGPVLEEKWAEYNLGIEQMAQADIGLAAGYAKLDKSEIKYWEGADELEDAKEQLEAAEKKVKSGWEDFESGLEEYNTQRADAEQEFADALVELEDAAVEIADGKIEIAENQQEFDEKVPEVEQELEDARIEIADSEEKLLDMGEPKWYILDRNMNESYVTYSADVSRMHDLATVFPVVFFLVAALVCLTTMTRMVDEDRTLIGTFKALGYSNQIITGRYLQYAAGASLLGSSLGVILGFKALPALVWNAYGIMYALPEMRPAFYWGISFLSVASTVLVVTLSTGLAAKNSLSESPADLMRPKAPKSGKRIFLEYVDPIWKRLSFTQKVTVRNLGLNKKRLLMSLIGVVGCTALVVTAFGVKNAMGAIVNDQFGKIFLYDITVGFNDEEPSAELLSILEDTTYFSQHAQVLYKSAEVKLPNGGDIYNVSLVTPQDVQTMPSFVALSSLDTGAEIFMDENSVILTEKMARNMKLKVGDTIVLTDLGEDEERQAIVTEVAQNYTFNYVYMGPAAYENIYGEAPEYNEFFGITSEDHTLEQVKDAMDTVPGIGAVSFTEDLMGNIRTTVSSVDDIIWILIFVAGLLAFVVLYNLTNINIGERERELATLKVLGFYDGETYNYIFRETIITSMMGALIGLFAGNYLYRVVVETVEPDMILLSRQIGWQGYVWAAILTMVFTFIVNQCMKPQIRKIDMLESLKSVD